MKRNQHEILILAKHNSLPEWAIEREMQRLNGLLCAIETPEKFCVSHELVNRNYITRKRKKILNAVRYPELKAFRFLIGKN